MPDKLTQHRDINKHDEQAFCWHNIFNGNFCPSVEWGETICRSFLVKTPQGASKVS